MIGCGFEFLLAFSQVTCGFR